MGHRPSRQAADEERSAPLLEYTHGWTQLARRAAYLHHRNRGAASHGRPSHWHSNAPRIIRRTSNDDMVLDSGAVLQTSRQHREFPYMYLWESEAELLCIPKPFRDTCACWIVQIRPQQCIARCAGLPRAFASPRSSALPAGLLPRCGDFCASPSCFPISRLQLAYNCVARWPLPTGKLRHALSSHVVRVFACYDMWLADLPRLRRY